MPTETELGDGWTNSKPGLWVKTYRGGGGGKLGKHVLMELDDGSGWIVGFELPRQNMKWRSGFANADDAMFDAYREAGELGLSG